MAAQQPEKEHDETPLVDLGIDLCLATQTLLLGLL